MLAIKFTVLSWKLLKEGNSLGDFRVSSSPYTQVVRLCLFDLFCQPSFGKVLPPSFMELGLANLVAIYSELCKLGKPPPIIDAGDLQEDPEVLKLLNPLTFDFHFFETTV